MRISWGNHLDGDLDDMSAKNGYGQATDRIVHALRNLGHEVGLNDSTADIHFHFDQPHFFKRPRKDIYSILYHPWESTKLLPPGPRTQGIDWLAVMNDVDEVWTPSPLIAKWYEQAGVKKPIYVFEHGVDEVWRTQKREVKDTFKFLHIGGEAARRGTKEAMQALRLAFPRNYDVELNMKIISKGWNIGKLHRVNVLNEMLPLEGLVSLYHENHVMLGISYGEGFGLTPLQGLATGMPVIGQPDWAPYSKFLDPNLSISSQLVRSPFPSIHPGQMLKPRMDDLIDRMRYAYDNFYSVADKAAVQADEVKKKYNWLTLTEQAFSDLELRLK